MSLHCANLFSQTLDKSFNPRIQAPGVVLDMAYQGDKLIVVGIFNSLGQDAFGYIIRLNANGTIDETFKNNIGKGASNTINSVSVTPDNKIIIAGDFTSFNDRNVGRIVRLNEDGTFDLSFFNQIGSGADLSIIKTAIQFKNSTDYQIIAVGEFLTFNGKLVNRIVRLNKNGSVDESFRNQTDGGANFPIRCVTVQSNNKILIGGQFTLFNSNPNFRRFLRLNTNGSTDVGFANNKSPNSDVFDIAVNEDASGNVKNIYLAGNFGDYTGTSGTTPYIARVNDNGTIDESFKPNPNGFVRNIWLTSNDKICFGGLFTSIDGQDANYTALVDENGVLDSNFINQLGIGSNNTVESIQFIGADKIVIGGRFDKFKNNLQSLGIIDLSNNTPDLFNNVVIRRNYFVRGFAEQANEKILIGGADVGYVANIETSRIFRILKNGGLDTQFNANIGKGPNNQVNSIAVQADGKILVAGSFTTFNDQPNTKYLVRLDSNGVVDAAFQNTLGSTGFDGPINVVKVLKNGSIAIGGVFTKFRTNNTKSFVMLSSSGTYDSAFNFYMTPGFDNEVIDIGIQSDNKIIVGGRFTEFNSEKQGGAITANRIIRFNDNGTLNPNFSEIGANSTVRLINIREDDKINVAGFFSSFNGLGKYGLARLNKAGGLDEKFQYDLSDDFNPFITSINSQTIGGDEKLLLSGDLKNDFIQSNKFLIRLNGDGTIDESFNIENAINLQIAVNSYILRNNNIILSGIALGSLVRLITPPAPPTPFNLTTESKFGTSIELNWERDRKSVV